VIGKLKDFLELDHSDRVVKKKTHLFSLDLDYGIGKIITRAKTQRTNRNQLAAGSNLDYGLQDSKH